MAKPLLSYHLLPRRVPGRDLVKYYSQKVHYTNIGTEELLNRILENTSVPRGVIRAAVEAITDSIQNFVLNGHSVELGGLMSIRPTIRAKISGVGQAMPPTALPEGAHLRLRAYWGNDVRKFQNPEFYEFERVVKQYT